MKQFRLPIAKNTVRYILEHLDDIVPCFGKDVLIIIGRENVGKSTTINRLLGIRFQASSVDDKLVEPCPGQADPPATMASADRHLQTTIFPKAYSQYVDTQGFIGFNGDAERVAAATVLLDGVLAKAKSVRLCLLEMASRFEAGATALNDIGTILNNIAIVPNIKIPMFILCNRFEASPQLARRHFYDWPEEQQIEEVKKRMQTAAVNILRDATQREEEQRQKLTDTANAAEQNPSRLRRLTKWVTSRRSRNNTATPETNTTEAVPVPTKEEEGEEAVPVLNDDKEEQEDQTGESRSNPIITRLTTQLQEAEQSKMFAQIISDNINDGHYGYIDCLHENVNPLISALWSVPPIPPQSVTFSKSTEEREQFNEDFEEFLRQVGIPALHDCLFIARCPMTTVEELSHRTEARIAHLTDILEKVRRNESVDELPDIEAEQQRRLQDCRNIIADMRKKQQDAQSNIDEIERTTVPYKSFTPTCHISHTLKSSSIVEYENDIPFVKVVETLPSPMKRLKLERPEITKFTEEKLETTTPDEIHWTTTTLTVSDQSHPEKSFSAQYFDSTPKSALTRGATFAATGATGWVATAILEAVLPATLPFLISAALFGATGIAAGQAPRAVLRALSDTMTGSVQFYVRQQDRDREMLNTIREALKKLTASIAEEEKRCAEYEKENQAIEQRISRELADLQREQQRLNEILAFQRSQTPTDGTTQAGSFASSREAVTACRTVIELCGEQKQYATTTVFQRLMNRLSEVEQDTAARSEGEREGEGGAVRMTAAEVITLFDRRHTEM